MSKHPFSEYKEVFRMVNNEYITARDIARARKIFKPGVYVKVKSSHNDGLGFMACRIETCTKHFFVARSLVGGFTMAFLFKDYYTHGERHFHLITEEAALSLRDEIIRSRMYGGSENE